MQKSEQRVKLFSVLPSDCDVQTFRAGGPGGQHQNKSETGVRFIHRASGARGECRETRSQLENKKRAWRRMTEDPKFKIWLTREIFARRGIAAPEEKVKEDMQPKNLKVEVRDQRGRWTKESS